MRDIGDQVTKYGSLAKIPNATVGNTRNEMYLASEALRLLAKDKEADLTPEDKAALADYKKALDNSTKFIPAWVKVAVAMGTIAAADMYGLPVSTTHILTSGVAGTVAANGSGLQWGTVKNLALAWVLTLPAAIMLSAGLFAMFVRLF